MGPDPEGSTTRQVHLCRTNPPPSLSRVTGKRGVGPFSRFRSVVGGSKREVSTYVPEDVRSGAPSVGRYRTSMYYPFFAEFYHTSLDTM